MIRNFNIVLKLEFTTRFNRLVYRAKKLPVVKNIIPQSFYGNNLLKTVLYILSVVMKVFSNLMSMAAYGLFFFGLPFQFFFLGILDGDWQVPAAYRVYFITIFIGVSCIVSPVSRFHFLPNGKYDAIYLIDSLRMNARDVAAICYIKRYLVDMVKFILFFVVCVMLGWVTWLDAAALLLLMSGSRWLCNQINIVYYNDKLLFEKNFKQVIIAVIVVAMFAAIAITKATYSIPNLAIWCLGILITSLAFLLYYSQYRTMNVYIPLRKEAYRIIGLLNFDNSATVKETVKIKDKDVDTDETINTKKGFDFFNAAFFRRHRSYLWRPIRVTTLIILGVVIALTLVMVFVKGLREAAHGFFDTQLASLMLIAYFLNRGENICKAMFFNCDSSMLVYRFYRKRENLLQNFILRLKTLIQFHLLPALVMSLGMVVMMLVSRYDASPIIYSSVFLSVLFMNLIFCIHSLVLYYVLQPYNLQMEQVGFSHRIITAVTYVAVYAFYSTDVPVVWFSVGLITLFVVYVIVAAILVYKVAPKTFRLRE